MADAKIARSDFYCYVGFHPKTGEPLYVGKGRGQRILAHNWDAARGDHSNTHLANVFKKYGQIEFVKVRENLTEEEAFETEKALIEHFGRVNSGTGILCNRSDGGDGNPGVIPIAMILAAAIANRGRALSKDHCKQLSDAQTKVMSDPKVRARTSAALMGITRSAETRKKMSDHEKTQEHRDKVTATIRARADTISAQMKVIAANRGPEHFAKIWATRRANLAKKLAALEEAPT